MTKTAEEEKLIADHLKILDFTRGGFICSSCHIPRKHEQFGLVDIFRPRERFRVAKLSTYMICKDCQKLDEDTIYTNTKTLKIARGEIIP